MRLYCENLEKHFYRKTGDGNFFTAVAPLTLSFQEGAVHMITGRSGSGKTTLLNMLAGLLVPTRGTVCAGDTELYAMDDGALSRFRNRHLAVIPQGQSLLPQLSVVENICLPAFLCAGKAPDEREVTSLLERLDLASLRHAAPQELSGGELRRSAIARALLMHPSILFCDEPTSDLDDENTKIILSILQAEAREGTTVILVTHETDAADYADFVYRMHAGVVSCEKAAEPSPRS